MQQQQHEIWRGKNRVLCRNSHVLLPFPSSFWAVGYAFAYGGDSDGDSKTFIGHSGFFLANGEVEFHNWFFQFAFACALSSIVAGTIAERTQMVNSAKLVPCRGSKWTTVLTFFIMLKIFV